MHTVGFCNHIRISVCLLPLKPCSWLCGLYKSLDALIPSRLTSLCLVGPWDQQSLHWIFQKQQTDISWHPTGKFLRHSSHRGPSEPGIQETAGFAQSQPLALDGTSCHWLPPAVSFRAGIGRRRTAMSSCCWVGRGYLFLVAGRTRVPLLYNGLLWADGQCFLLLCEWASDASRMAIPVSFSGGKPERGN